MAGIAAVAVITLSSTFEETTSTPEYFPRSEKAAYEASGNAWVRNMLFTGTPDGNVDPATIEAARQQAEAMMVSRAAALGLQWGQEGPDNFGGRTRAILVDRNNANEIWAGSVSGGLYYSSNHGDVWYPVTSYNQDPNINQAISSMAQDGNGGIYVGTGSSFEGSGNSFEDASSNGDGIWYSNDDGATWSFVSGSNGWGNINELAVDPNNTSLIWVGCSNGTNSVKLLENGSISGTSIPGTLTVSGQVIDLQVGNKDGKTVVIYGYSLGGVRTYVNTDVWGSGSWTQVSGTAGGQLPSGGRSRYEYAISGADANYIYAVAVSSAGTLTNIHMTEDGGANWFEIAPATTPTFQPFISRAGQGNYDCIITADPNNKDRCLIGGIDIYEWKRTPGAAVNTTTWELDGQWAQKTVWYGDFTSPIYVHADQHEMVWGQDGTFFVGNDGGVFRSNNAGNTFVHTNRGYSTTQSYNIAFSSEGYVMGGHQDNGTIVVDHSLNTYQLGYEVRGGDGFACDISHINSDAWFSSIYEGGVSRADVGANAALWALGSAWEDPYDFLGEEIAGTAGSQCGDPGESLGSFYTASRLAEWPNDVTGMDSLFVILDTNNYNGPGAGSTVTYISQTGTTLLSYTEQAGDNFNLGDTVVMHDPVQSWYAFEAGGGSAFCGVIVTRDALRFSVAPHWLRVAPTITDAKVFEFNPITQDLFVGTLGGDVWRIDGLEQIYSWVGDSMMTEMGDVALSAGPDLVVSSTKIFNGSGSNPITGIAIDHNDPSLLAFTRGGTTGGAHVYQSTSADTDPTTTSTGNFTSIQGDLGSNIPVYAIVYDQTDVNNIIIGTEYGIMTTDNGGTNWVMDNTNIGIVPVYDLRIQTYDWSEGATNPNRIYAGTNGRGIWSTGTLVTVRPWDDPTAVTGFETNLNVFPNPLKDQGSLNFELAENNDVYIQIFDLTGNLIYSISKANMSLGAHTLTFDATEFASGTYLVDFRAGDQHDVSKFIVR